MATERGASVVKIHSEERGPGDLDSGGVTDVGFDKTEPPQPSTGPLCHTGVTSNGEYTDPHPLHPSTPLYVADIPFPTAHVLFSVPTSPQAFLISLPPPLFFLSLSLPSVASIGELVRP